LKPDRPRVWGGEKRKRDCGLRDHREWGGRGRGKMSFDLKRGGGDFTLKSKG